MTGLEGQVSEGLFPCPTGRTGLSPPGGRGPVIHFEPGGDMVRFLFAERLPGSSGGR